MGLEPAVGQPNQLASGAGPQLEIPSDSNSTRPRGAADRLSEELQAEQTRLEKLARELEVAEEQLTKLQAAADQASLPAASPPDQAAADVKAALDQANVLKRTTAAAQKRLEDLRSRVEAAEKTKAAESAQDRADSTTWNLGAENPFTLEKLADWGWDHGPRLLAILLGTLLLYLSVQLGSRHMARLLARGTSRGTLRERENRVVTLVGVFQNVATIVVLGGGTLMLLQEVGIPILPLMGGAAVLGLAVAFGSQNLIRDYFSGFMLLLEDQYGINDVVKIGDVSGAVEQITLRVTVLRDLEGTMHFIPHGTITNVSNMTHGWSRALLDIGVAYKEDTDRVMATMLEVAREMREDSEFGPLILEDAEMLGVDLLGDSSVSVKMVIKTHPLKRWAVKREYLRRIKHRFDKLGIEIPFPYRTVLLRQETEQTADETDSG